VIAYKFLREDAVAPFTKVNWQADRVAGVHACRVGDLPLWMFDELWEVELEAPVSELPTHVVAASGRLHKRIERWNAGTAGEFARACAQRTHQLGHEDFAADADAWAASAASDERIAAADAACVAYIAAHAAGVVRGAGAEVRERAWQAEWLVARLGLGT
jgi:hypothetical protein